MLNGIYTRGVWADTNGAHWVPNPLYQNLSNSHRLNFMSFNNSNIEYLICTFLTLQYVTALLLDLRLRLDLKLALKQEQLQDSSVHY